MKNSMSGPLVKKLVERIVDKSLMLEELLLMAAQYRSDLIHPLKNGDSIERRLAWIDEMMQKVKKEGEKK
jgi:hypothetical protein